MTEHRHERRRHGRRHTRTANLYQGVIEESDAAVLAAAQEAEGLTDEVAVVRALLLRHLAGHPENLELTIKGMHLLVRMVTAQAHLSGEDAARLQERTEELANHFAAAIFKQEAANG